MQGVDNVLQAFVAESWASARGAVFDRRGCTYDPVYLVADQLHQCPSGTSFLRLDGFALLLRKHGVYDMVLLQIFLDRMTPSFFQT